MQPTHRYIRRALHMLILYICTTHVHIFSAEETAQASGIRFTPEKILYYNYISSNSITQKINNDSIHIVSTVAWQFALRCNSSDENGADLLLTIQILEASIKDPAVEYYVNSSEKISPSKNNILRHLLLLNGKSLRIRYNYKTQSIDNMRGGEDIIAAIRTQYPDDDFGTPQRITQQAEQQFSDASLLRLWKRILLGAQNGTQDIKLGQPLQRTVTRSWGTATDGNYPYTLDLKKSGTTAPKGSILNTGANNIDVELTSLSGTGFVHISQQQLIASTQTITAELRYSALTQEVIQSMTLTWKLAQIDPPALAPAPSGVKAVDDRSDTKRDFRQK